MKELKTERLLLRGLRSEDAESLAENMDDEAMAAHIPGIPYPYTLADARGYIKTYGGLREHKRRIVWAVEADGELIGSVSLHTIHRKYQNCFMSYSIARAFWGNGYATEACRRLLEYAFDDMKMHFVGGQAHAANTGSTRVLEKLGFSYDGIFKEHTYHRDEYHDLVNMSIREQEFKNQ